MSDLVEYGSMLSELHVAGNLLGKAASRGRHAAGADSPRRRARP